MKVARQIIVSLGIALSILLVSFGVLAWIGPTTTPPEDDVPASLDISSNTQYKSGSLHIGDSVGIGTQSPREKLEVDGRIRLGSNPTHSMDIATKGYVDNQTAGIGGGIGSLSELNIDVSKHWNGYRIKELGSPVGTSDAATKEYVDAQIQACLNP